MHRSLVLCLALLLVAPLCAGAAPTFSELLSLEIPLEQLKASPSSGDLLRCRGSIGRSSVRWVVSCGHWERLQPTEEEVKRGKLNLFAHLEELLPREQALVGLVSVENGVNTSPKDFKRMVRAIRRHVDEGTLLLGLYNRSSGIFQDKKRFDRELRGRETEAVRRFRLLISAISGEVHRLNPEMICLHIAHSEGGLIAYRALEGLSTEERAPIRQHFYICTLASAHPIPKRFGIDADNIYSEDDMAALRYAKSHLDEQHANQVLPSKASWHQKHGFFIDHAFLSPTYQEALAERIHYLREKYGFYGQDR